MKHFAWLLMSGFLLSCNANKEKDAPFITNDSVLLEEYADKALQEAEQKVDSLFTMPLLDTSYFSSPQ
jgi:hypothetical protein